MKIIENLDADEADLVLPKIPKKKFLLVAKDRDDEKHPLFLWKKNHEIWLDVYEPRHAAGAIRTMSELWDVPFEKQPLKYGHSMHYDCLVLDRPVPFEVIILAILTGIPLIVIRTDVLNFELPCGMKEGKAKIITYKEGVNACWDEQLPPMLGLPPKPEDAEKKACVLSGTH